MIKRNFMLAALGILALGVWLLPAFVTRTVPAATEKRSIIIVPSPLLETFRCDTCGVIVSTRLVSSADTATASNTASDAASDAVIGGLIGNLLGGARGQELFGWLGALSAIRNGEVVLQPNFHYETTVRFDNGASRVFVSIRRPRWRDGDRVRVVEGAIQALSPEDARLKAAVMLSHLYPVAPV